MRQLPNLIIVSLRSRMPNQRLHLQTKASRWKTQVTHQFPSRRLPNSRAVGTPSEDKNEARERQQKWRVDLDRVLMKKRSTSWRESRSKLNLLTLLITNVKREEWHTTIVSELNIQMSSMVKIKLTTIWCRQDSHTTQLTSRSHNWLSERMISTWIVTWNFHLHQHWNSRLKIKPWLQGSRHNHTCCIQALQTT